MAKAPEAGRTKTRLCPPLTPQQAADLYAACARDVIENALALASAETFVAVTPPEGRDYFERAAPGVAVLPVEGATIGRCLDAALTELLARGHPCAAAVSSDSPDLWPEVMARGIELLNESDVVFGPSHDGGYYFVGLKSPAYELFSDEIAWSTEAVLAQSLARAEAAGLSVGLLPALVTDVDTAADLARLASSLPAAPPHRARHTRAALRRLAEAGVALPGPDVAPSRVRE
jgi:hypothetical protein